MKPLLDCRHLSSNGSLSHHMSYISSHIHSVYPWILISSSVIGILSIGEPTMTYLYRNLVVDTNILLSIVILSPLTLRFIQSPCSTIVPILTSLAIGISSSITDRRVNQPILHSYADFVIDTNLLVLCPVYRVLGLVSVPLHLVSLPHRASYNGLAGNTRLGMTYISQSMYPHPSHFFFINIYTSSYMVLYILCLLTTTFVQPK